jgi:threonine synthase
MFYYVWAARESLTKGSPLFVVPSGNLGNITGGILAARAGLPHSAFLAACNENDIYPQFLHSGTFTPRASQETVSNAMDVGNPSNFFRLQHLLQTSTIEMHGAGISDSETVAYIRSTFEQTGYILDPHTAVGVAALNRLRAQAPDRYPHAVVLATAHPAKFASTVRSAIGSEPILPPQLGEALERPQYKIPLSNTYEDVARQLNRN